MKVDFLSPHENIYGIPKEMLYLRLKDRGRENEEAILKRIQRSEQKIAAQ
ncbi:MAG: hypothetical protein IBX44_09570 [Sulfurospirillum sp.]|nr:hypothetical protein [Sulfurospirillum sp.]